MKEEQNKKDAEKHIINQAASEEYKYGFVTDIETNVIPKGLNEDVVRQISALKNEPEWLLDMRLKAYAHWLTLKQPTWGHIDMPEIDFQDISYYAAPRKQAAEGNGEIDPELKRTFDKLGIPLEEQMRLSGMAVDAVMDSVSVHTTYREKLAELGVIFCSISEAVKDYPDLIKKYLGKVVPYTDNFYAALNTAVFSDGSFVYIPKGVRCPMELSTYFRINAAQTGQFERTLIVADDDSYVSYLEGCTAPMRDENQLHAAIVEIIVEDRAEVKYSTVQNWYPGDKDGKGGIYNLVTKRGLCRGDHSKLSWTQVETGSAITWKYPSCILKGDHSVGEFYSVALTRNYQQADTGTKMIHLGRNSSSTIVSKGISAGHSQNSYRGLVKIAPQATGCRNYTQCDSLLLSDTSGAHTFPVIEVDNDSSVVEHEATTSKINEDQIFYCNQRGISTEDAVGLIVNGYAKEVMAKLPMEFAVEAQKLLSVSLEGSIG
ncbi:MAG: Fe-S cluster assembly protein SufB [Bacteroidales bacterium]|uniref:Fe-S cluster assembly protein SufB n=1 Tax=Sodaliphilus sp. TaxID=2815818 RepID=UPI001B6543FE|nr:Fe-S cluster assembly protein SufB [Candidatus Sodaliphilus limicaballi]